MINRIPRSKGAVSGAPWNDINTASYDNKSHAAVRTNPEGASFHPDGTKFYLIGDDDFIYQYSLPTPWADIDLATYDSKTFGFGGQQNTPTGLFFKPDGTGFYVVGSSPDVIHQYSLPTPWADIDGATYDNKSFGISEDTSPKGVFFKPDGTGFYVVGDTNNAVFQYSFPAPWADIDLATYDSKSFGVGGQDSQPSDVFFRPDGTGFYIIGATFDFIHQYSLPTPWADIDGATYDNKSFEVGNQESAPLGMFFKQDGTRFYICGNSDRVYQYSL